MKLLHFSRGSALVTAIVLPVLETWRRFGTGSPFYSWLDDFIAAGLLFYAWYAGRKALIAGTPYLMAAWGYTFGIAYMSFFGHLDRAAGVDVSGLPNTWAIGFKGFGLAFAIFNLFGAWRARYYEK